MSSFGSVQKTGLHSWKLTVSAGSDGSGKRIRHTKTIRVTGGDPEKQRKEAEKQLALFEEELKKGQAATSGKMTLDQFHDYWKENYSDKNHEATTQAYHKILWTRITAALGHMRIDKIEPKHLLAFYKNLAEPGIKIVQRKKDSKEPASVECLSPNTIRKHHTFLHSLFAKAVQWNLIPYNPAARVEPPKAIEPEKQIYDQEMLSKFLAAMEPEPAKYKLMVLLALTGGLRREEVFGLEWKDVDLDAGTIHIQQASVYIPETGTVTKDPKNAASNRVVSFPASIMVLLKQYKAEQSAKRLKLGGTITQGGKWAGADDTENDRLFTQWNGVPSHPHCFNTWLKRFIAKHNLPHISPHSFRHMTATYLIVSGVDIRTVSGKLGHAKTSTTMNIYSHLLKSAEQETADKMENFLQETKNMKKGPASK